MSIGMSSSVASLVPTENILDLIVYQMYCAPFYGLWRLEATDIVLSLEDVGSLELARQ